MVNPIKKILQIGTLAGLIAFGAKTAKADEIFLKTSYNNLNPTAYNAEISKVSSNNKVFSNTIGFGVGFNKDINEKTKWGVEANYNSQSIDATIQNVQTQQEEVYGSNALTLVDLTPSIARRTNPQKMLSFEAGVGLPLTLAMLKSTNQTDSQTSLALMPGIHPYVAATLKIGKGIVRAKAGYNLSTQIDNMKIDGYKIALEAGIGSQAGK